jgi:hypothetical protein
MSFKILHQFKITIEKDDFEVSTRTENGQEISVKTKVKKPIVVNVILKEPSRREKQDISLFKDISYSKAINLGLIPRLMMTQKLSKDPANPISGDEDKTLAAMNARLQELANDYIRLNAQSAEPTEEDKARKERLVMEYTALNKKATDISTAYQSVFAHTAEQYAQNRVLTHLTLFLTYIKVGPDKYEPMFKGTDFEAKEEALADLEDANDSIYLSSVEKLSTYWMLYYFGRASKPEEFAKIEEDWVKEVEAQKKLREEADKKEKELNDATTVIKEEVAKVDATPVPAPAPAAPTA